MNNKNVSEFCNINPSNPSIKICKNPFDDINKNIYPNFDDDNNNSNNIKIENNYNNYNNRSYEDRKTNNDIIYNNNYNNINDFRNNNEINNNNDIRNINIKLNKENDKYLNINEIDYNDNNYNYKNPPNNQQYKSKENVNNNKFKDYDIISEDTDNNNNNNKSNFQPNINSNNNNQDLNLIKIMAVLSSSKEQNWKDNIKSFVSSLYYNGYTYSFSKKCEQNSIIFPLYIFNKKIDKIIRDEIKYPLKSFLYMSYRSGFINLSNIGLEDCTTDCGWGCMVRCCQMLLSKGLIQKKIYDYFVQKNSLLDNNKMTEIRKEVLCLFNDNYLSLELTREHPDFQNFWKKYEIIAKSNPIYNSISEIIPPYSIHILCKLGGFQGIFTSDLKLIKLFCQINSEIFNDMNFIHFENGNISRKKLLNSFCEECNDFNRDDLITYNGIDYQFKKPGIVFISLRLGLYSIESCYYDFIPLIFSKFRNNFGFVGGKKNRAYYFIGIQGDNTLIFVDPHVNQQITNDIEKDYESYYTENLYLLDINELTSSITFAVGIFNALHFTQFLEDLKWFDQNAKFKEILYFSKDK